MALQLVFLVPTAHLARANRGRSSKSEPCAGQCKTVNTVANSRYLKPYGPDAATLDGLQCEGDQVAANHKRKIYSVKCHSGSLPVSRS